MRKRAVLVVCMVLLLILSMSIAVACDNNDKEPIDNGGSGIIAGGGGSGGNGGNNGGIDNGNNEEILNERELVDLSQYLTYQVVGDDLSVKGLQEDKKNAVSGVIDSGSQYIDKAKIVIPDYYKGKKVIGVESEAFSGCIGLRSITIPDSVTSIGYGAFKGCSGLTSISIPESVTSIETNVFYNCSSLTNITIAENVTSIGSSAFFGCSNLTEMTIPFVGATKDGSCDVYFGYIFGASNWMENETCVPISLKRVTITGGTSIGDYAFYGCSNLTNIIIPDSVTSIGECAFSGCGSLTSLTIPDGVVSMPNGLLSGCASLESLTIPFVGAEAGKTSSDTYQYPFGYIFGTSSYTGGLANTQFYYGSSTSNMTYSTYYIPSKLVSVTVASGNILGGAFCSCGSLTNITIGKDVKSIEDGAFGGCNSLIEVYNQSSLNIIVGSEGNGKVAYYAKNVYTQVGGSKLSTDEEGYVKYTDGADKILVKYIGEDTDLTLPNGITEINQGAFFRCSSITSITIPNGVTSIGEYAFSGCSNLTSVTIPNGVVSIRNYAFNNCSSLTSIAIPDGVTSIGERTFKSCTSLTSVIFKENSNLKSIESHAFSDCRNLTSIAIPNGVTSIGERAFEGCTSLTSVTFKENSNLTSIGGSVFEYCYSLTSITLPNSVTNIGYSAFRGCSSLTRITIPDSVTSIGSYAFYGTAWYNNQPDGVIYVGKIAYDYKGTIPSNTSITIKDGILSIANSAFYGCSSLTSITIPDSVASIGDSAFKYCYSLIEVYNKSSLNIVARSEDNGYIGYYAKNIYTQEGGSKLSTDKDGYIIYTDGPDRILTGYIGDDIILTMPSGITEINQGAFGHCMNLTSITILNGVTSIGDYTFSGCYSLTNITIPNSVTSIGNYTFDNCISLTRINFQGTKSQWNAIKKGASWNNATRSYIVYCTDGSISK